MTTTTNDPEYDEIQRMLFTPETQNRLHNACYKTNNRYAYIFDLTGKSDSKELKHYNFSPSVVNWCIACDKRDCFSKCGKCKSVYFCNVECQKKAWSIHKQHCGRDLFTVCALCGVTLTSHDMGYECKKCPLKYCSLDCCVKMTSEHDEMECSDLAKTFGKNKPSKYTSVVDTKTN